MRSCSRDFGNDPVACRLIQEAVMIAGERPAREPSGRHGGGACDDVRRRPEQVVAQTVAVRVAHERRDQIRPVQIGMKADALKPRRPADPGPVAEDAIAGVEDAAEPGRSVGELKRMRVREEQSATGRTANVDPKLGESLIDRQVVDRDAENADAASLGIGGGVDRRRSQDRLGRGVCRMLGLNWRTRHLLYVAPTIPSGRPITMAVRRTDGQRAATLRG